MSTGGLLTPVVDGGALIESCAQDAAAQPNADGREIELGELVSAPQKRPNDTSRLYRCGAVVAVNPAIAIALRRKWPISLMHNSIHQGAFRQFPVQGRGCLS
jgi:hypothetical protein